MNGIKKAVILVAGMGTRFLPLSRAVPKELLPLADKPTIHYLLQEAVDSGIKEVVFVVAPGKKQEMTDYLKRSPKLEKILKDRKKDHLLERLKSLEEISKALEFSFVVQKEPLGDGHAVLQAKKIVNEPCVVFFTDDIIDSRVPCAAQLAQVFKTCQRPVLALRSVPKESIPHYGVVSPEKIASRFYKIKSIVEKPSLESAPSDLALIGRSIITPDVFDYLKKAPFNQKGEIILAEVLNEMAKKDGKVIYGHEIEGEWLECGDLPRWMKANLHFSLKHERFGPELKEYLKQIKIK